MAPRDHTQPAWSCGRKSVIDPLPAVAARYRFKPSKIAHVDPVAPYCFDPDLQRCVHGSQMMGRMGWMGWMGWMRWMRWMRWMGQAVVSTRTISTSRTEIAPSLALAALAAIALSGCEERRFHRVAPPPCTEAPSARSGQATHYAADGTGACSFDATASPVLVAALARANWDKARWCGSCAAVTGPMGTVVVRIVDSCPGCAADSLDLSREAFATIAPLAAGRIAVTWQPVACPVDGPLQYRFKVGSNPQWMAIQLRNHRYPITGVQAKLRDDSWIDLDRKTYNYFVATGLGPGPHELRVSDARGHSTIDRIAMPDDLTVTQVGHRQLPVCEH
jgi:expansin